MDMEFDNWLEEQLKQGFHQVAHQPLDTPRFSNLPPLPWRNHMLGTLATAAKSKVAIVATTAALVTGGGVAAKAAITGNANPFNWGHTVHQTVIDCKANLQPGQHGIGSCVSAVATQHGSAERKAHSQAGDHGPNTGANGHATKPSPHPDGRPSVPAGPPSS
jgi:hypothetical protein